MKFLDYLNEDYVTSITGTHWKVDLHGEIFVNPSVKELNSLVGDNREAFRSNTVRFIINFKAKKLYVCRGDIVHYEIARVLKKSKLIPSDDLYSDDFWNVCMTGVGDVEKGKIRFYSMGGYGDGAEPEQMLWLYSDDDYSWLKRWFSKPLINDLKVKYGILVRNLSPSLKESYFTSVRGMFTGKEPGWQVGNKAYKIFTNPTQSDLREIIKDTNEFEVRFAIDMSKNIVYVWSWQVLHYEVIRALKLNKNNLIVGEGYIDHDKIDISRFGNYLANPDSHETTPIKLKELMWADKYFTGINRYLQR